MTVTRIVHHEAGYDALRTSPGADALARKAAEAIADEAGDGYVVDQNSERRHRAGYTVYPATPEAIRREARDHPLLGALDAGRG